MPKITGCYSFRLEADNDNVPIMTPIWIGWDFKGFRIRKCEIFKY